MMLKAPIFLVTLVAFVAAVFPIPLMADNPSIPPPQINPRPVWTTCAHPSKMLTPRAMWMR